MNSTNHIPLIQAAVTHAEFESIHPFRDGNGRLGRMLITLMLWDKGLIGAPNFYISGCIEKHKDKYIDLLRSVSALNNWTEWCVFFCELTAEQAHENCQIAENIRLLYDDMRETFRRITSSQWSINALDFVFAKPVFRNSVFTAQSGIPRQTAYRITSSLAAHGLLSILEPASGRRAALYAFDPLLEITRT